MVKITYLLFLSIFSVTFMFAIHQADAAARFGGQTLILIVSDAALGAPSELAQKLPIISRPDYYHYDRVITLSGQQVSRGALREAAIKSYQTSRVIDVMLFSHGAEGLALIKSDWHHREWLTAQNISQMLQPMQGKLRLFYTAACEFGTGVKEIVETGGATVAISHSGINVTPFSFPLKFLKYFKLGSGDNNAMSAGDAATKAFDYFMNDPNPIMKLLFPPLLDLILKGDHLDFALEENARSFAGSKPILAGNWNVKGSDLELSVYKKQGPADLIVLAPHKVKLGLRDLIH